MSTDSIVNDCQYVTLDDALRGETQAPPLNSDFSVLLVGILKPNSGDSEGTKDTTTVRLYPPDGRENRYYLIKKRDVDTERVEPVSPKAAAARGWISERIVRIRVRASAQLFSIQSKPVEARRLSDEDEEPNATSPCTGYSCTSPYRCRFHDLLGGMACVHPTTGKAYPCPNCS
jgi:hypothetical protein